MCNCISYNNPEICDPKGLKEVILNTPEYITDRPNGICVDACIVDIIKILWAHSIHTMGSCCGHNINNPSLVIHEDEDAEKTKEILMENDDRNWEVFQWKWKLTRV